MCVFHMVYVSVRHTLGLEYAQFDQWTGSVTKYSQNQFSALLIFSYSDW